MPKLKAKRYNKYDRFSKEVMNEALEKLKYLGLEYYKRLNCERSKKGESNLTLHHLCLCQGAALYYAHLIDPETNPAYCGVKDFDVWLFVSGYNKNYSSRKPKKEKIFAKCKPKKVDLLIYNSEDFENKNNSDLIKVLQNDRDDRKRETAICLLDKAIIELPTDKIEILPDKIELLPDKKILYVNKEYSDKHKKC